MTRFPFTPLVPLIESSWRPLNEDAARAFNMTIIGKTGDLLGVCPSTVRRWMREGLGACSADRAATALGFHPGLVWQDWWLEDAA